MNDKWVQWVRDTTGGAPSRAVADKIGRSHTTALKWMHDEPAPEAVIAFAVAYDTDVIAALVAAGWLNNVDEDTAAILRTTPTLKLTAELHRRAQVYARRRNGGL